MKSTILALLVFVSVTLNGQVAKLNSSNKADIEIGQVFKGKKKATLNDVWAVHDDGFYTLIGEGRKDLLANFTDDMQLISTVELDLNQGNEKKEFERLFSLKNEKLYLMTTFRNVNQGKRYLFLQTIDEKTLIPNDDIQKLAEIDFESKKESKTTSFSTKLSRDSSKVLVMYHTPYSKEENERFGAKVFDADFNLLWENIIEMPYRDENFSFDQIIVSNEGDVYVAGKLWKDDDEREKKEKNYTSKIIAYTNKGEKEEEYDFDLNGKFADDYVMAISEEKNIVCSGFYKNKVGDRVSGCFLVAIDPKTKQVLKESLKEFSIEFMTEDLKEKDKKKLKKKDAKGKDIDLLKYDLSDFILRSDGGAVLIGEQFYITSRTSTDSNGNTRTTYYYNYNDLIVINIDPDGNIEWASKVKKRQVTANNGRYSSYVSAVVDDNIYIIYNDNPKNLLYNGDGKIKSMNLKEAFTMLITVDSDGLVFREALMNTKGEKIITRPKVSEQIRDNELLIYAERGKNKAFINVKLK